MKGKRIFSLLLSLALLASLLTVPAFAAETKTLTLREDWRLTEDLDLAVPAGTTLTIDGNGHHIYEMGGMLKNSGAGDVTFVNGTILYPAGASESCTTETSIALMAQRKTGSTGGGTSTGGGGSTATTTETVTNPDGSTTTTVTDSATGTVTETTKYTDGSTQVVETKKDGSSTTTITKADGSTSTTTVSAAGQAATQVTLSQSALDAAQASGQAAALPMSGVTASSSAAGAPAVTVDLPVSSAQVEIPVENVTPGTVAVLVAADGSETVIKASLTTETGVAVTLSDGDTVKIVDNTKTFADVPSSYWGSDEIAFAASRELFQGTSDTTFQPELAMSRAMMLTVLARYDGVDTSVGNSWYEAGAAWAVNTGISDGTNLEQSLTREQLALMLYRYAGEPATSGSLSAFGDAGSVSAWATQGLTWAVENGLVNGVGNDLLSPQGTATRAQVAAILARFVALVN